MILWSAVNDDGKPRTTSSGGAEIRFMLVPASQCEIIDTWTVGGLRGTGSHDVVVNDVFVPSPFSAGFIDPHVLSEPRYRIPPFSRVINPAYTTIDANVQHHGDHLTPFVKIENLRDTREIDLEHRVHVRRRPPAQDHVLGDPFAHHRHLLDVIARARLEHWRGRHRRRRRRLSSFHPFRLPFLPFVVEPQYDHTSF